MKKYIIILLTSLFSMQVAAQSTLIKALILAEGLSKAYQAVKITDKEMSEYMAETMKQMDRQNNVCSSSSPYTQRLKRITKGMREVDGTPLNFKVYKTNEANAFASPDGSVRVYSKLMDIMTDEELLGVIGHELGHVAHHDSRKEYRNALLTRAARDGLMLSDGTLGNIAASTLGGLGEVLINAKYSRKQESAADDYGYDYLKKHGVNPWAMAMAFEKLEAMHQDRSGKYTRYAKELLSSHPDMKNRIERMSKKAKADGYKRPKK